MTELYDIPPALSDVFDAQRVLDVRLAVEHEDVVRLHMLLDPLHPADIADLLEQVSDGFRTRLLRLWKGGTDGDVLSELDESIRETIIDGQTSLQMRYVNSIRTTWWTCLKIWMSHSNRRSSTRWIPLSGSWLSNHCLFQKIPLADLCNAR